jgi:hypothetical protein
MPIDDGAKPWPEQQARQELTSDNPTQAWGLTWITTQDSATTWAHEQLRDGS